MPQSQAKALVAALKKAGHEPDALYVSQDGHGLTSTRARREGFRAIEQFLAAHLGPAGGAGKN